MNCWSQCSYSGKGSKLAFRVNGPDHLQPVDVKPQTPHDSTIEVLASYKFTLGRCVKAIV